MMYQKVPVDCYQYTKFLLLQDYPQRVPLWMEILSKSSIYAWYGHRSPFSDASSMSNDKGSVGAVENLNEQTQNTCDGYSFVCLQLEPSPKLNGLLPMLRHGKSALALPSINRLIVVGSLVIYSRLAVCCSKHYRTCFTLCPTNEYQTPPRSEEHTSE